MLVSLLRTCLTRGLSLLSGWCCMGAIPWSQPWMPTLTPSHMGYERNGLRKAVLCTCSNSKFGFGVNSQLPMEVDFA